jgi:hypothetical protein
MRRSQKRVMDRVKLPLLGEENQDLHRASANLALEGVAVRVSHALRDAGVRAILLKGPALASWLYPHETRVYSDVDLLVNVRDRGAAEVVLEGLGFRPVAIDVLPHDRPQHARTWLQDTGAAVDLHHTLVGAARPSDVVWAVLTERTEWLQLGDSKIEILSVSGRALVIALHAAQHGVAGEGPLEDLRRVIERLSLDEWHVVRLMAEEIGAVPALAAGLRLSRSGSEVAVEMNLPEARSAETVLRATSAPTTSLGFEWLSRTHGFRRRSTFVARKIVPTTEFIRDWTPLARRGRAGLAAAYVWRVVWLAGKAAPAYIAWRKAQRAASGGAGTTGGSESRIGKRG